MYKDKTCDLQKYEVINKRKKGDTEWYIMNWPRKHLWCKFMLTKYCLTFPPTAWNRNVSVQVALASSTLRLISSNDSNIETNRPGQLFAEKTSITKPFSVVSTVTCLCSSRKCNSNQFFFRLKLSKWTQIYSESC